MDFLRNLFSSDFMPHGHCYFWKPEILWLHVFSDAIISVSYYSIPIGLIFLVYKRKDLAFDWIFTMFAVFIFACGTSHLMEIWTVWQPMYRLEGVIKAVTGLASLGTAVAMWALIPKALRLPTVDEIKEETRCRIMAQQELFEKEEALRERTREGKLLQAALSQQKVLLNELDHRVKNTLQVVLSLAQQTIRQSPDLESFQEPFEGRIHALARVHRLLTQNKWESLSLDRIVRESLQAYWMNNQGAFKIHGEEAYANAKEAQSLHMVLHELATNAIKYGALSSPKGCIYVNWRLLHEPGATNIELVWREEGGPPPSKTVKEGFGTTLIKQTISFDLGGQVEMDLRPEGLFCKMVFKLQSPAKACTVEMIQ